MEGHADDEDARYRFYSLRPQLVSDGPDEAYITLNSPPNHKGERPLEKYYACENGQIVDGAGIPYPPFRHHSDRIAVNLLHPAGLVLNFGNKLMWKKENERYYAQKGPDEEYDSFAGLERGIRLAYEAMELLVQRFFTETEDPDEASKRKGPPPDPPLYAEIEAYSSMQPCLIPPHPSFHPRHLHAPVAVLRLLTRRLLPTMSRRRARRATRQLGPPLRFPHNQSSLAQPGVGGGPR